MVFGAAKCMYGWLNASSQDTLRFGVETLGSYHIPPVASEFIIIFEYIIKHLDLLNFIL
jgi:hypothetical protein